MWTLDLLSPHNILLSKGLVTAEWAFSSNSLKRAETDPYPVHRWTGKQFQLQCWTNSPLRVSKLCCLLIHLSYVDGQPYWGTWMNERHCKPAIFEKSQIWNDKLLLQWLKGSSLWPSTRPPPVAGFLSPYNLSEN